MIENYLLEELVTFNQTKTLAKTAEKLMVTQPTITRGMQKLEEELGVTLFDRQPNKITLTKVGKLAAEQATNLLKANQDFITQIRNFAREQQIIKIGTTAPGPFVIAQLLTPDFSLEIDQKFVNQQDIKSDLINHRYSLIFNNQEIQTDQVESLFIGTENLSVHLDQFMLLASQQSVTFKDLRELSFIVLNDIGPWKKVIQDNIPDAKFLYQTQRDALAEITKFADFPSFTTNVTDLVENHADANLNRVKLPISDEAAKMPFYVSYLKSQRSQLHNVLKRIVELWP
ncbi:LysR family transcriptional regulator [Limosilactobacillus reuteri]|uniref:LysR family transcriptional regulator n=1 Tax=Limosilactobacillus reuteri TaxID=1598 RepID=A0AAW4X595_LIMRT|nr:LysR family transcriptional regulator [Limosilactobacillus reuteri]MCC4477575.1 LysR family transcriptional regulator [Limosilactobacillus reuteri]MCC4479527.1 LysR family transcriptional regulator [Limosilactobacillus reuteri]MCC4488808.1 LysR family transcriptional regulator [Limosilactobacillus reuteri]MCC4493457.1 LysR family transcriptional regulator [Limosilactobacillus reuteri]MCC4495447.1 LysR family transcriptional regulator [Limosilactobacillus reuteri]